MKKNTVRYPLKLKLLTVMLVLISLSLTVFVGIALKTFKEDKTAYIFETLLNKALSGEIILSQQLEATDPTGFSLREGKLFLGEEDPTVVLNKNFKQDSSYVNKIVVPVQGEFYEWHKGALTKATDDLKAIYQPMIQKSLADVVKEVEVSGVKWLYAYHYNSKLNFAYVVALPQEDAFAVTKYLINKSLFYGVFILGIAMVLSVLLARPLTASLEKVYQLTQEIASGNFQQRISVKSNDEVGVLGESVNHMADKIVQYMEEMKEKARLENEVAVAQLVQSSFFPPESMEDKHLSVQGYFEPATECGGDWWGVFESGDWKVIFIADATGHGVPAALLTATINCCKTSLSYIVETRPHITQEPHEILRYMNQAVHGAGHQIQVTCFVATFNKKTLELHYSNASHTPALLYSSAKETLTKEDFQPLIEAVGPRLGQAANSSYEVQKLRLASHDTILLYTDGLTEAENAEGQRWGERRLIKALSLIGPGSPKQVIGSLVKEFKTFSPNKPKDDITIVAMKVLA